MRAIITADWHLREDKPRCRTDEDWRGTQEAAMKGIADAANAAGVPVVIVGDLFHRPTVPSWIISAFLRFAFSVKSGVYVLAGNHDLLYHSIENLNASSFGVLAALYGSGVVRHPSELGYAAHFGGVHETGPEGDPSVYFLHRLIFPSAGSIPPNVKAQTASELVEEVLKDFPGVRWIFTGDYHQKFIWEEPNPAGRGIIHVVNPGSLLRQAADQKEYAPGAYLVDTEAETVEEITLKADSFADLVTDEYLRTEEEREDRIASFVESVRSSGTVSLDFLANVENRLGTVEDPAVKNMILSLIGG